MDEYKGMTDKELIARLKKYSIPHGPLVGSTRKLYEKKIYEYETERTQYPSPGGSHTGRAFASAIFFPCDFLDPSPTKSYLSYNYNLPHHEEHSSYASEGRKKNESAKWALKSHKTCKIRSITFGQIINNLMLASALTFLFWVYICRDSSSSYQSIFQRKSSGLSSLQVQPRRAIHPERQAQAAEKALESNAETKRYLPLWLQLLVFGLLAAFLVFIYFLEGGADGNPFVKYISQ
uniref:LEM domain-containing protein n=1 Tax=Naja naja TaxID=35670 RepID=A0A8C6YIA0_NAJNA